MRLSTASIVYCQQELFRTLFLTSYYVVNTWLRSQLGLSSDRILRLYDLSHLGIGIFKISEHDSSVRCFSTCRHLPYRQPFVTHRAFLHDTDHACGKLLVLLLDERPRVTVVKAPRAKRTCRHAEPAADAAVHIMHYHAVLPFEGGLGRTYANACRMSTVIAEKKEVPLLHLLVHIFVFRRRGERMLVVVLPDPLHLVFGIAQIRHVVDAVAGVNALLIIFRSLELAHINDETPPCGRQRLRIGMRLCRLQYLSSHAVKN